MCDGLDMEGLWVSAIRETAKSGGQKRTGRCYIIKSGGLNRRPGIWIRIPKVACESQAIGEVLVATDDDQRFSGVDEVHCQLLTAR